MEPIESSETSAYSNTLTPGTYPKDKKLQIYLLIKYIKSILWRVAKCLSYIEEALCLKVNYATHGACLRVVLLTDVYRNLTSL